MKPFAPLLMTTVLASTLGAAQPVIIPLWPEGVPAAVRADVPAAQGPLGAEVPGADGRLGNIAVPTLEVFPAAVDRPTGTAVVICPGGGYGIVSYEREGHQFARWLSGLGVTSFILKYRLKEFGHPAPIQDVLRAIRIVRSRAAEFKIDPARIGIMGSSAGGHLAATASTLYNHPAGRTGAALDGVDARPDFAILMYPVITFQDPAAHAGSRTNLLGANPPADLVDLFSLEKQVTSATPPTLLIHTQADTVVPIENSILYFQALTRAKVPAEAYLFEHGTHGMGLNPGFGTASAWTARAEEWLRGRGLLAVQPK